MEKTMRLAWSTITFLMLAMATQAIAPRTAAWTVGQTTYLAALTDEQLHLGQLTATGIDDLGALPAKDLSTLAAGKWNDTAVLLAARQQTLLRLDTANKAWIELGTLTAPLREILPSTDGKPGALLLTGTPGDLVPKDGAVWWADWTQAFTCTRLAAVKENFRPWQIWWTQNDTEQRFAAATYKATQFAPFEHNCMFLFTWKDGDAEACWLGSRLTRPYIDATHADIRGDGQWRMIAVEETRDNGHGLGVYIPIGFGYGSEWHTETILGLQRVAAYGNTVICWGHDMQNRPCAWQLLPDGDAYRLSPLTLSPPSPEAVAYVSESHLAGWWGGAWQSITLPR